MYLLTVNGNRKFTVGFSRVDVPFEMRSDLTALILYHKFSLFAMLF